MFLKGHLIIYSLKKIKKPAIRFSKIKIPKLIRLSQISAVIAPGIGPISSEVWYFQ